MRRVARAGMKDGGGMVGATNTESEAEAAEAVVAVGRGGGGGFTVGLFSLHLTSLDILLLCSTSVLLF